MARRINYEDDIFTLALHVRCLQDTLKLEIDAEFFLERILDDIAWLDSAIGLISRNLMSGSFFVKREEHLKELQKLRRAFSEALSGIIEKRVPFADSLEDRMSDLRSLREDQEKAIAEIRTLLSEAGSPAQEEEHIVSAEELKFLMTSPDEGN